MLFKTRWLGVYFHIIRRPDYARCEHDHPWPFAWSLVIRGPDGVSWGFRTALGKVSWQTYVMWSGAKRVLWCDDRAVARGRNVG